MVSSVYGDAENNSNFGGNYKNINHLCLCWYGKVIMFQSNHSV